MSDESPRDWAKEQSEADERIKIKIEEIAARFGIVKMHENDRWWQVFVSVLSPASRPWLKGTVPGNDQENLERFISDAADAADAAIAEAQNRGRL